MQRENIRIEVTQMKCTFLHKRIPVAELELDETTGAVLRINAVMEPAHLPIGVTMKHGSADRKALNEWWLDRAIPASRSGIREALETLDVPGTGALMLRCFGLSLSDQYWFCPEGSGLTWDEVNFFENDFSEDVGNVLFGAGRSADPLNLSSPDNTSDGNLTKRWKVIEGKRCLIKGGSAPFRQQPFNEVIASGVMDRLGILHIPYTLTWNKGAPYSVCEDFVTADTELIPAWRILQTQKKPNDLSLYQHFLNCCEALGAGNMVPFLDRMIVLDYIIANEDRHLNNFGLLRNAETLEWLGPAPIYDSGSSLGYDKLPAKIRLERDVVCKPFKNHHAEQLRLVSSFDWLDFDRLADVRELIYDTMTVDGAADYLDEARIAAVADAVERRIQTVQTLAMQQHEAQALTAEDDVEENIAASYGPNMTM